MLAFPQIYDRHTALGLLSRNCLDLYGESKSSPVSTPKY
jgi:hypothetical protein